jgi:serine-type D-Ala-D-Ala carboxypeptidase (penicillin-binding protein 5/6)
MNEVPDNIFITEPTETESLQKFPVVQQLLILGVILLVIFSTFIIPKSLTLLSSTGATPTLQLEVTETVTPKEEKTLPIDLTVRAKAAYVYDLTNGTVLYEKNADEALPLASITKLMTTLVAYELVPDDTPITISGAAANQESGGTLTAGETFPVKELADFTLVSSYNSAAYMLAASVGELLGDADPTEQFVAGMNLKAQELGLSSLTFHNATGLDISATDAGAYGNAKDVSALISYILMTYPEILQPTMAKRTRLYNTDGGYHEAENTNDIVSAIPNLLGSKTGYTDLAGGNLTIVYDAGFNRPIVITILGSTHNERFTDMKKLVQATEVMLTTP